MHSPDPGGCSPTQTHHWVLQTAQSPTNCSLVVLFLLLFSCFFVQCRSRFATSVPVERSSPICQGTKVSIRIFFLQLSISVYILKSNSMSNGENVSPPKVSINSVSSRQILSKSDTCQPHKT